MQLCTNFVHRLWMDSLFRPNFLNCCKHATCGRGIDARRRGFTPPAPIAHDRPAAANARD